MIFLEYSYLPHSFTSSFKSHDKIIIHHFKIRFLKVGYEVVPLQFFYQKLEQISKDWCLKMCSIHDSHSSFL